MRVLDPVMVALAIVLVPGVSWLIGKMAGRRNLSVVATIAGGIFVAVATIMGKTAVMAAADGGSYERAFERRMAELVANPELLGFLLVFGAFMAMLAWSATPAATPRVDETGS